MFDKEQVGALKSLYPKISTASEGDFRFIRIDELKLPSGCAPDIVSALLCPMLRDNYPSRLFLSKKIAHKGRGQHWNADGVLILGQQWWGVSWKTTKPNQTLLEMVLDHLGAFRT
jgi:hypothetical protein